MKQMEQIHGEYRRDLNHNYLILDKYDTGCEDTYEIRMLEENHLKCLLECQMRNLNGKNQFFYEISSKQPMAGIYDKKALGFEDMYHLCRNLMKTLDETEDYYWIPAGWYYGRNTFIWMWKRKNFSFVICRDSNVRQYRGFISWQNICWRNWIIRMNGG